MKVLIRHRELFNASHTVERGEVCGVRLHGHDWYAEITVEGHPDPQTGEVETEAIHRLRSLLAEIHERDLNAMLVGAHPTPEGVAMWLLERMRLHCPGLASVTVGFTGHSATVEV